MEFKSEPIKAGDPVIVSVHEYQGRDLLDIRHYYQADSGLAPTKKGVSLPSHDVAEILKVVRAVVEIDASLPSAANNQVQVKTSTSLPVIVSVSHWKGYKRLDIRHYFADSGKKPVPTQKGVSIPWEQVETLIVALSQAESQAQPAATVTSSSPTRTPEDIMAELGLTTEGRFSNIEL